ncbi:hypothetical protein ATL39_2589 [Sinobaca qinghaiensis]|uniref:Uncharacterized protein n=1 Tax=Sinobaca qinghaiensis TaxID=342944 RepID=A0A419UZS8_9BACL|nr:hypothetical protein [Sinobaca qinghaiensis]RKD71194.1 hypothetical protein ATL39_2589 [Sinobaca qinghaiensis]
MKFTYKSYSVFVKKLGYFDSVIEMNEVAIREFADQANSSGDFSKFLACKSKKHKIRVDFPKIPEDFNSIIAKNYIAQVSQCFEEFLVDFQKEYEIIKKVPWLNLEKNPKLKIAFKSVDSSYIIDNDLNYKICDYYRNIRNSALHNKDEKRLNKLDLEHNKVSSMKIRKNEYSKLNAPNKFKSINFDDFILYSRAAKEMAFKLCELSKPNIDEVVNLINEKNFSCYENNSNRKHNALITELKSKYGIQKETAEIIIKLANF